MEHNGGTNGSELINYLLDEVPSRGAAFLVSSRPEGIYSGIEKVASFAQASGDKLRNGVDRRSSQIHMSRST